MASRHIAASLRREIIDCALCAYCGRENAVVVDHVIPVSRGGTNDRTNLAPACWPCNSEKSDATPEEWRTWREAQGLCWPPDRVADLAARIRMAIEEEAARHGMSPDQYAETYRAHHSADTDGPTDL